MVTASRDTTIKVWDKKWLIQTIFVGHTGEGRGLSPVCHEHPPQLGGTLERCLKLLVPAADPCLAGRDSAALGLHLTPVPPAGCPLPGSGDGGGDGPHTKRAPWLPCGPRLGTPVWEQNCPSDWQCPPVGSLGIALTLPSFPSSPAGPVTAVTIYPQGPFILSASQDGTIRTWNLQTIDQVDEVQVAEVVEQLQTHPEGGYVVSLSGSSVDLWKVNQLYSLHTRLGAAVTRLCTVDLSAVGSFPVRVACACQDSTVRLVAAHTGRILSTLLLDRPCQAVEVAYCLPKETLFVLLELGQLLRVNTAVNPMSVKKIVVPWSESARPRCLLLYSHLVDPEKAYAQWREILEQKGDKKSWTHLPLKLQDKNR